VCSASCRLCSKVSVKYQECKATCNTCDELRSTIQADTKLQVRVVQQLSACIDLLPSCAAWVKESRCTREPKSMLELCQVCTRRAVATEENLIVWAVANAAGFMDFVVARSSSGCACSARAAAAAVMRSGSRECSILVNVHVARKSSYSSMQLRAVRWSKHVAVLPKHCTAACAQQQCAAAV
jgi:hypothetical protein